MEKFDYLVVGSGLYGSIFAHEAKAHGKSVLVVDKRPNIAGNIYTENIEGIFKNGKYRDLVVVGILADEYHALIEKNHYWD